MREGERERGREGERERGRQCSSHLVLVVGSVSGFVEMSSGRHQLACLPPHQHSLVCYQVVRELGGGGRRREEGGVPLFGVWSGTIPSFGGVVWERDYIHVYTL